MLGSPAIDWDFGITIDTSGPEPTYEVVGAWDGYPAAELYINRQPVFRSTPGSRPGSFGDLLKLLPGYADSRFITRGILHGNRAGTSEDVLKCVLFEARRGAWSPCLRFFA